MTPLVLSHHDTTSVKQLPYYVEKQILVYAYKNSFLDISPWPNFFSQKYCIRSNVICINRKLYFSQQRGVVGRSDYE